MHKYKASFQGIEKAIASFMRTGYGAGTRMTVEMEKIDFVCIMIEPNNEYI